MIITYSYLDQYNQIGAFDTIDYSITPIPPVTPAGRTIIIAAEDRTIIIPAPN